MTANYVQCLRCDREPEVERCTWCSSTNVDVAYKVDDLYLFWNPTTPELDRRCWDCGSCWLAT